MDEQQILSIILQNTFTRASFLKRLAILRGFLEAKFFKKSDLSLQSYLESRQIIRGDKEALLTWQNQFIPALTAQNSYRIINKLTEKLKDLPVITVYIAVLIPEADIDKIGSWFRTNLGSQVMLEIYQNATLVAGCAFVWMGSYHDYSLHNLIIQKKDQISALLDRYASNYQQ